MPSCPTGTVELYAAGDGAVLAPGRSSGTPAGGIPREGRLVQREDVAIHAALRPGQRAKRGQQRGAPGVTPPARQANRRLREAGRDQREDRQAGQVLKMIRHVREEKREDVDEAEDGEKRAAKQQRRRQRAALPSLPPDQSAQQRKRAQQGKPLPPDGGVDRPVRIDENEIGRPYKFAEVEPKYAPGQQSSLHHAQVEIRALGTDNGVLEMSRDQA